MESLIDQVTAAEFLGLKATTLEAWRVRGCGPKFIRLSNRAIRYWMADLVRYVRAREVEPAKKIAPRSTRNGMKLKRIAP